MGKRTLSGGRRLGPARRAILLGTIALVASGLVAGTAGALDLEVLPAATVMTPAGPVRVADTGSAPPVNSGTAPAPTDELLDIGGVTEQITSDPVTTEQPTGTEAEPIPATGTRVTEDGTAGAPPVDPFVPAGPAPRELTVGRLTAPVDIDTPAAQVFGWQLVTGMQTSYQVRVATTRQRLITEPDVWDSGKVSSGTNTGIRYDGPALDPLQGYYWQVRIWDTDEVASAWSEPTHFGTGPGDDWGDSRPIWTGGTEDWTDYTLSGNVRVTAVAAGITVRASDAGNFYLVQFRTDTGTVVLQKAVAGKYSVLATERLTGPLRDGTWYPYTVQVDGSAITVSLNGTQVLSATDDSHRSGGIGVRHGRSESAEYDDLQVTLPDGRIPYRNGFDSGVSDLPCATANSGFLVVSAGVSCSTGVPWSDYTVDATVSIRNLAAGLVFRAVDHRNYYLWQLRAGSPGTLVLHKQVNGVFTVLATVKLPTAISVARDQRITVEAVGPRLRTSINGQLVNVIEDRTFSRGTVGFRSGGTESTVARQLTVTRPGGTVAFRTRFPTETTDFGCPAVVADSLTVSAGLTCLLDPGSDWAFLRGETTVESGEIAWAHLYATAASTEPSRQYVYSLSVNGRPIGVGPTRPVSTETRYDGYDVTDLIRPGAPVAIGVQAYTVEDQRFLAHLVIRFTDGRTQTFGTGPGWRALSGAAVLPSSGSIGTSYYTAPKEDLFADAFPTGYDAPGFDDHRWGAVAVKGRFEHLLAAPTADLVQQRQVPLSMTELSPGHYLIDYGRTWVGGLALTVDGTAGQVVELRFGSEKNGNTVRHTTRSVNRYRDTWTLRQGHQQLSTWGMRVFRYIEIIGAPRGLTPEDVPAITWLYPFDERTGIMHSSSGPLNEVWELSRNTIESLNGNLYVDTWERERHAYEGDAYLQMRANAAVNGDLTLADYTFEYLSNRRTWPTEWPMYLILAAYESYLQTGDVTILERDYAELQAKLPDGWFEESTGLIRKERGSNGGSGCTNCDMVDWPLDERDNYVYTQYNTVINALGYRSYADMALIAAALGRGDDARAYGARAEAIRAAMNERMWDQPTGAYRDGLFGNGAPVNHFAVHASVFAVAMGVADPARTEQVAGYLARRGMACSVYCAGFFVEALYQANDGAQAYRVLTATGNRSWLGMKEQQAGATMEAWNPQVKVNTSFSHPWGASPAYTIPEGVFGIRPTAPGYDTFQVKPQTDNLAWADLSTQTVKGTVGVSFHLTQGRTDLRVHVPANSTATVYLPVAPGSDGQVYRNGEPVASTAESGYRRVDQVPPGCQVFSTAAEGATGRKPGTADVCADTVAPEAVTVTMDLDGPVDVGTERITVRVSGSRSGIGKLDYSGTVEVHDGDTHLGSGVVSSTGLARVQLFRPLAIGTHTLRAVYSGSPLTAATSSDPVTVRATFRDHRSGQFLDDIAWLAQAGITRGTGGGVLFQPDGSMTRRDFAAWLYRVVHDGATAPGCATPPAKDVPVGSAFCGEVAWLYRSGLTTGYADGTFRGNVTVTRQQVAAFLFRLTTGSTGSRCTGAGPFSDVPATATFCEAISWAADAGITRGYTDGRFHPGLAADRQAVAAFLHRYVVSTS